MYINLIQQFGLDYEVAKNLARNYGDRAFLVADLAAANTDRWPFFGKLLVPHHSTIEAEVKYVCRFEYAQTIVDVIARRTRLSFLDCQSALEAIPKVGSLMQKELNWSSVRKEQEMKDAKEFLKQMGLGVITATLSVFNRDRIIQLKKQFNDHDPERTGTVNVHSIKKILKPLAYNMDVNQVLEEVVGSQTQVHFNEFLELVSAIEGKPSEVVESAGSLPIERSGGGL